MARLTKNPAPGHWSDGHKCIEVSQSGRLLKRVRQCKDWREHSEREDESLTQLGDAVWTMPVADNYARYFIKSETPLVLAHIPYADAYRVLPATIRGLRLDEVQRDREFRQRIRELIALG